MTGFKTTVVAEPRSNALIVRAANQARLALAINLIDKLDQPVASVNGAAGNIYVVYLKNANATQLATTLRAAMGANGGSGGSAPVATGAAPAPQVRAPPPWAQRKRPAQADKSRRTRRPIRSSSPPASRSTGSCAR